MRHSSALWATVVAPFTHEAYSSGMRLIIALLALSLAVGCANVTTMKIKRSVDGSLSIDSGKDVTIGSLDYQNPQGENLQVREYTSNANTDVIKAQTEREKAYIEGLLKALQAGAALATKGVVP